MKEDRAVLVRPDLHILVMFDTKAGIELITKKLRDHLEFSELIVL